MTALPVTLAVETSSRRGSVALLREGARPERLSLDEGHVHGRTLVPAMRNLIEAQGLTARVIDLLAVGLGPGSYTGLRVGAAAALGFSLGTGCPLVGVSSFAALVFGSAEEGQTLLVSSIAGEGECAFAVFRKEGEDAVEVVPHAVATWEEAADRVREDWVLAGEGAASLEKHLTRKATVRTGLIPDASHIAPFGRNAYLRGGPTPPGDFKPLYLRRSKAEINWELKQKKG